MDVLITNSLLNSFKIFRSVRDVDLPKRSVIGVLQLAGLALKLSEPYVLFQEVLWN